MTRIGTGLGARTRVYAAQVSTTFRQLESANPNGSEVPRPGIIVVLDTNPARTLDSAYAQGIVIQNLSATETIYVGGQEFAGLLSTATAPGGTQYFLTSFYILPNQRMTIDVRDGTGIYLAATNTVTCRIFGN